MGLVVLFALVVGAGLVTLQVVLGASGGHHGDLSDGGHDHPGDELGVLSLFASLRFWIFAILGFGLSGTLLHWFARSAELTTGLIGAATGIASGLFASLLFRSLKKSSVGTESRASLAVGKLGRIVVPCGAGCQGQVRVEIAGSSVDLLAEAGDEALAHGDSVVIVDVQENVARVSRLPEELG
jgi:membrane protein implicated in regulation of membrane protease activity